MIDPEDKLLETSEENNEAGVHIYGYEADLVAGPVLFRKPLKPGALPNNTLSEELLEIAVTVSNVGRYCRDVENVEVNFTVDGKLLETRIISVKAGGQAEASVAWWAKKGTHNIRVSVDPANRFDEVVETNNDVTATAKVSAQVTKATDYTGMAVLAVGIIALALVAGVLMYQSTAKGTGERAEGARPRPRLLRARAGPRRPLCTKCGKPVPEGGLYFKCGCGAVYHKRCDPEGTCERCAAEEEE
jgi:hypothetical protein